LIDTVNCIEAASCPPQNPLDVLNLYDTFFGAGFSLIAMALILGMITLAIYVRTRSLPMLTILGIYEIAAFGAILTSKYISSQYHAMEYVLFIGGATGITMLVLRLLKE